MLKTLLVLKVNALSLATLMRLVVLSVTILTATTAHAQRPFITTWKTDNPGSSNSSSITISTVSWGSNYEVDWNNDGIYDQTGIVGSVTHDFWSPGTYTIRIRGAFTNIVLHLEDRLKLLEIKQWGDIAWTTMERAFSGCANLSISATDLPKLSGVTSMASMFMNCTSLNGPSNIGDWNTANVVDMSAMFMAATSFNQPIGNWNTAKVENMNAMFAAASAFNQPIGSWNTGKVIGMGNMFGAAAAFNQPIGSWNTANVIDMQGILSNATSFNQSLSSWSLHPDVYLSDMLNYSGLDCENYSATLIGWSTNPATPNRRYLGAIGQQYGIHAATARTNLSVTKSWLIEGDVALNADCSALPVVLISFTGKSKDNNIVLTWDTSSEISNAGFEIEKSTNARTFVKIGFVDGGGDSKVRRQYNFLDADPLPTAYYRLKQLDFNGQFEYSRIISVKKSGEKIVIYPNPTSSVFHLKGLTEKQKLVIRNVHGEVVLSQLWSPDNSVKVGHLANGLYFLSIAGVTRKVIVQKKSN
ncbi:BspA family leucine-rich repeat surface protein [Dyadobacter sp. CY326]|uniref:BspA family leucine-rich repeat surface protein n=1 Tax=Dyadobacter sp. CY326 TaxID=2907300 RepID=UPI001F165B91|nr:BspA family leucine-rich repeat surface protein [Dyadobacter sp. CY326]MCE7065212.1 BspA family leucine-rich repeat surface protein [Dyadobacter sp. CY326]